jgi:putative membrane protein
MGMMGFMMLFWILVIVAVIAGIVWVVRQSSDGSSSAPGRPDQALNILRERYARGEVTKEEFERMRRELK